MKKKQNNWIFNIFLIFIIFCAYWACIYKYNDLSYNYSLQYNLIIYVFSFIIVASIIYVILSKMKLDKKQVLILFFLILGFGLILRGYSICTLKNEQVSDFGGAHWIYGYTKSHPFIDVSLYKSPRDIPSIQSHYATFPTWYFYHSLFVALYNLIGYNNLYVKLVNCLLFSVTLIFLYLGTSKMFNKKVGLLSILFLSYCPNLVIYTNIATPDHFVILLMSIVIFLWSIILKKPNNAAKYWLTALMILFMCLINYFKPLSIYMLLVFICSEILINILGNIKNFKNYLQKSWKYITFFIVSFLAILLLTNKLMNWYVEKSLKMPVINPLPYYMLWGYSVDENGNYSSNYVMNQVIDDIQEKCDYDQQCVVDELAIVAKENFKNNIKYLDRIITKKFSIAFAKESDYFEFTHSGINDPNNEIFNKYYYKFLLRANGYMFSCFVLIIITCVGTLIKKDHCKEKSIILLMIAGYIAVLVLGGVQQRYKSLVFPQFAIMAALGVQYLGSILANFKLKISKRERSTIIDVNFSDNSRL